MTSTTTQTDIFTAVESSGPILISTPHDGKLVPAAIQDKMTEPALTLPDTDWHVAELYRRAAPQSASRLFPWYSRYVVDLNRPPDGGAMYPGQRETGLCPVETFDDQPIYRDGEEPTDSEVDQRVQTYWQPYHQELTRQISRLRANHEKVLLWEGHTIASRVPRFFSGTLPEFSFGSDSGRTFPEQTLVQMMELVADAGYSCVANQRFKGGHITRHYATPDDGVFSLQLELSQSTYLDEGYPYLWNEDRASRVITVINQLLAMAINGL